MKKNALTFLLFVVASFSLVAQNTVILNPPVMYEFDTFLYKGETGWGTRDVLLNEKVLGIDQYYQLYLSLPNELQSILERVAKEEVEAQKLREIQNFHLSNLYEKYEPLLEPLEAQIEKLESDFDEWTDENIQNLFSETGQELYRRMESAMQAKQEAVQAKIDPIEDRYYEERRKIKEKYPAPPSLNGSVETVANNELVKKYTDLGYKDFSFETVMSRFEKTTIEVRPALILEMKSLSHDENVGSVYARELSMNSSYINMKFKDSESSDNVKAFPNIATALSQSMANATSLKVDYFREYILYYITHGWNEVQYCKDILLQDFYRELLTFSVNNESYIQMTLTERQSWMSTTTKDILISHEQAAAIVNAIYGEEGAYALWKEENKDAAVSINSINFMEYVKDNHKTVRSQNVKPYQHWDAEEYLTPEFYAELVKNPLTPYVDLSLGKE